MASSSASWGERLTLPYFHRSPFPSLKVDIYPFLHPPSPTSPSSSFPPPAPFVLYIHSASRDPFFSGSRTDLPPWLLEMCEKRGWPLVVGDYRLAPEVGVGEMLDDLRALWDFVANGEEPTAASPSTGSRSTSAVAPPSSSTATVSRLNWAILAASPASEADTGPTTLGDKFALLQQGRGLDATRCCVLGGGIAGSYLALRLATSLSPAPLATAAVGGVPDLPSRRTRSSNSLDSELIRQPPQDDPRRDHHALLARAGRADLAIVSALERGTDASAPARRGSESWWRSRLYSRGSKRRGEPAYKAGRERRGIYDALLEADRLVDVLKERSSMEQALDQMEQGQRRYPPLLICSPGRSDTNEQSSVAALLASLRARDPTAAVFDDLLGAGLAQVQDVAGSTRTTLNDSESPTARSSYASSVSPPAGLFDPSRRFLHRRLPDDLGSHTPSQQQVHLLSSPREDVILRGELDALEAFFAHWFQRGPTTLNASLGSGSGSGGEVSRRRRRDAEKL